MVNTSVDVNTELAKNFEGRATEQQQRLAQSRPDLPNVMRRGAHPKHHGLVRAVFAVSDDVPVDLRAGLFSDPRSYTAYVRFSNSGSNLDDRVPDAHGMAIKLFDVRGEKLLADETRTQDFLLVDATRFVAATPEQFLAFLQKSPKFQAAMAALEATPPDDAVARAQRLKELAAASEGITEELARAKALRRRVVSPVSVAYHSQTAYRLGSLAVKYQARPRVLDEHAPTDPELAGVDGENYLGRRLGEALLAGPVVFDFLVQRGDGSPEMPIDDPTVEWSEARSPFVKVATLTIVRQAFAFPEQQSFAESISFNPWHSLPAHEPLGAINRSRRDVYVDMARARRTANGMPPREPDGVTDF